MHTPSDMTPLFSLADGFWTRTWLRHPASTEVGRETDFMFIWLWWFCVIWFVGLMILMVIFVIKYRRKPGTIAPPSSSHNTPLEIVWTVIPSLFLVWIFFKGFYGYIDKIVAPGHAIDMNLTAFKWGWQINYPNGSETPTTGRVGFREIPVFYMPAKTPVRLKMQSKDVLHAFWVPDFRIKQDVVPNRLMTVWFEADGPNEKTTTRHEVVSKDSPEGKKRPDLVALSGAAYTEHLVFCAEYCGTEHSEMAAFIRVVEPSVYEAWHTAIGTPSDPIELGKRLFKTKCASCHTDDGSSSTGPTWKDLYGKTETLKDGSQVLVDDAYILESIFEPGAKIVKGYEKQNMTSFRGLLNPSQVQGILEYMKSISVHAPKSETPTQ
ncbi:MAG: cytochrome c oxidase subunit 2 [Phycisphaerae bacterium]|nr:MAG: cytochrome c oxidase subunit 2 [Phycisphaerae bacterium]